MPRPGGLSSSSVPSSAPTRSASPRSPVPRAVSAPPRPSSATSTSSSSSSLRDPHAGVGRSGVLRHVGEALGDHEVGRGLDRRGKPAVEREAQLDRDGGARGEALQGGVEAPLGEHRGVDPGREVAQLVDGGAGLLDRPVERARGRRRAARPSARARAAGRSGARPAAAGRRRAGRARAAGARRPPPRRSARATRAGPRRRARSSTSRRSFSIARPAAPAAARMSSSSSRSAAACTSAPTRRPRWAISVATAVAAGRRAARTGGPRGPRTPRGPRASRRRRATDRPSAEASASRVPAPCASRSTTPLTAAPRKKRLRSSPARKAAGSAAKPATKTSWAAFCTPGSRSSAWAARETTASPSTTAPATASGASARFCGASERPRAPDDEGDARERERDADRALDGERRLDQPLLRGRRAGDSPGSPRSPGRRRARPAAARGPAGRSRSRSRRPRPAAPPAPPRGRPGRPRSRWTKTARARESPGAASR